MVILVLLLSCCGQSIKMNEDVAELREKIPQLEMPLEFNSDRMVKLKSFELPQNKLINELREKNGVSLLGKVFETEAYITILGYIPNDRGTPVLLTYDNRGKEISSHIIYESAGSDMGHYATNVVRVFADRQIFFTDSTTLRTLNEDGTDEIPGTDSVSVTHKKYRLTDHGTIERVY